MKNILTFEQLNESKKIEGFIENLMGKFFSDIDREKLRKLLSPYKETMIKLSKKYNVNGSIDVNKIHTDIKSLSVNERHYNDYYDFDDDDENNIVLRYLYKFFIKWPKNIIVGIWGMFKLTVIESFQDGGMGIGMGILGIIMWILAAILAFLVSVLVYQVTDHTLFGLKSGVVKSISFEPAHSYQQAHTLIIGKTTTVYYTTEWKNDAWHAEVKGGDRLEKWETQNRSVADNTEVGDSITNDDNWTWEITE